jgi:hypothetical protein
MLAKARLVMRNSRQALNVERRDTYMAVLLGIAGRERILGQFWWLLSRLAGFLRPRDPATRNGPKQIPVHDEVRLGVWRLGIVNAT